MNRALAQYTLEEREALDRVLVTFPGTTVGPFEPYEPAPDAGEVPNGSEAGAPPTPSTSRLTDGLSFALGAIGDTSAVWGRGDDVLWAAGETTLLVGPDGVGKTTLIQRLFLALLEVESELLGLRVEPAERGVLYVAADRPKQAARSLWRMVKELDLYQHGRLREGLLVWQGPLPFNLVDDPEKLATWPQELGASNIVLDSLGLIVPRLTEDETGSAIAQAFAYASAAGVEVLATYHPRKANAENRKPSTIADVYGSRWLTAASGSVLSLWGSPGDPVLELRHLKQPAGEVGPMLVELDQERGTVAVVEGSDLLGYLRAASAGLSAKEAAAQMEGATAKAREMKARRRLESYVRRGLAYKRAGEPVRGGVHEPDRYFATPPTGLTEPPP